MPKGRMLNKKISLNKILPNLSIYSQLLFTWSIPHLDIHGKFHADPSIIKGVVVPFLKDFTLKRIEKCLQELHESGLVTVYGNGYKYMIFNGFTEEQKLDPEKEARSEIPDPTPDLLKSNSEVTLAEDKLSKGKLSKDKVSDAPPHWIQKLIQERMVQVGKLKTQPTLKECLDLESAFPPEKVKEVLWAMENYKKLTSNYVSVYLTALKWLKKEGVERKKVVLQKCEYCLESFGNLETHKKSCNKNPANTISKSQATDMLNKLGWEKK